MRIEDQVCSLELAKRLKELGVDQEYYFSWFDTEKYGKILKPIHTKFDLDEYLSVQRICSAFTVAELEEILFDLNYNKLEQNGYLHINIEMVYRSTGDFYRLTNNLTDHIIDEIKGADARAKMIIYLLENNLITLEEINNVD